MEPTELCLDLRRRAGVHREDYEWIDRLGQAVVVEDHPGWAMRLASNVFWNVYRPQLTRWGPEDDDPMDRLTDLEEAEQAELLQRLAMPDLADFEQRFLEQVTVLERHFAVIADADGLAEPRSRTYRACC